ncbi:formyltransferase family protein [Helicobacter equorum]|uniref:phosphoribosylglycinamide formyltransferase 1 n=1 Tax=Helicobacter equorum TaxID=361872 RepID=A0A3D8IQK3_9HELI|nr:formyltransferase family protein [Helicobacter equorum]MCI7710768.1 phosphoribosylglycinamide formyltransferase [Helicobacter sp.]MDD7345977.1 formyltransferase family protein [Helicobacter sp.]MDY2823976.1 formyltransferase family protein [Helicobacter sp.]RDU67373.1 phosphoribosylglycinamide formyltransferase [Helicobacter equorum]
MKTHKLFILFSGTGSNMINLIRTLHLREFVDNTGCACRIEVVGTLCNNPQAKGIQALQEFHIPCVVLSHKGLERHEYDTLLVREIKRYNPTLCVLSGFMRILTPIFTQHIRAINIHPSFLPYHKGAHAIKDSFESTQDFGGVSVHWVSEELDSGTIIMQEKLPKIAGESLQDFESKIHTLEYKLFPQALLEALGLRARN